MCGIVGSIGHKQFEPSLHQSTKVLSHRGPDDSGEFIDENIFLGHRRLSIQDLSANGHQPMLSKDGRFVMVFNGEIYNHWEIRQSLKRAHSYSSTSDSETILNGYIELGTALFAKLNGIFAIAIYDKKFNELVIARDHFGTKPLYYYSDTSRFLFASELKALTIQKGIDKTIDYEALINYISFLYSPGEKTPLLNIKKLLPGHFIKINAKNHQNFKVEKYYDIPFTGKYSTKTEAELIDELDHLLLQAVKRQLLSDVPVGFFLSGGVDSSAIVAMAKKILPRQSLQCYTIDTKAPENAEGFTNDLKYAKIVAKHLEVDLHIIDADVNIVRDFDKMIYHLDEPQADAAPLNVLNICRAARKNGHIVLLGGTGGDDLFSGYRRHQAITFEKYFKFIPTFAIKITQSILTRFKVQHPFLRRAKKLLTDATKTKMQRFAGYFLWLSVGKTKSLFNSTVFDKIKQYEPTIDLLKLLENIPNEKNDLNKMLYWEMKTFLCDHNLNYTDKLSMAEGVEVRVPFLDLDLVEFSTKLPPELKLKGTTTKYLLKKVMERYLPDEIIYRPKAGFGAPVRYWITSELSGMISDSLSKERIAQRGIFDFEKVQTLINENKAGTIDASYPIWALLAIESWFQQFIDHPIND